MVRNIKVDTAFEFIEELISKEIISFSNDGIEIADKLESAVQRFATILLASNFLDAMLFALSRIKTKKKKSYRLFEFCDIKEIIKSNVLEDKDSLSWFLVVFFILHKIFPKYNLWFRSFEDFVYSFTRKKQRLSSQFKYIIIAYLNSLAKFLKSMFGV